MSPILINLIIIVASILALWFGADLFVEAAARIARKLGLSELIIGLTIVAMGTSAPEFAVTARAALTGMGDISVGNVVGSNIFNLGFILGMVAVIRTIHTTPKVVFRDGTILVLSTLLLLLFMRDNILERWEGIILFVSLLSYIAYLMVQREYDADEIPQGDYSWLDIPRLLVGLALIVSGGYYLVDSSVIVARSMGLSEWAIGVTVVAAGTSAPEAVTSIVAIVRGHEQISLGNLIGSNIFNVLGVLGFAAMIRTLSLDNGGLTSLMFLTVQMIFTAFLIYNGWQLSRREGYALLGVNFVSWLWFISSGLT